MKQDPTLYESWTPTSTCHIGSLIGPAIGAVGSLIGGSQAAGAAEDASEAQVRAAEIAAGVSREALGFQKEMYNVGRADLAPYRATGAGALQTMNQMFLPGGHQMVQMQGQLNELRAQRARLMGGEGAATPAQAPGTGGGGSFPAPSTFTGAGVSNLAGGLQSMGLRNFEIERYMRQQGIGGAKIERALKGGGESGAGDFGGGGGGVG